MVGAIASKRSMVHMLLQFECSQLAMRKAKRYIRHAFKEFT
jgi:hypothetical protein